MDGLIGYYRYAEIALGKKMALPQRKLHSVDEFVERFPGVKRVMIDGTERPIQRPQDKKRQKENYFGYCGE